MTENASGIILRTRPLTETSLIVHWLTSAQGRISTVAKGARRAQSPFRGKLDLFYFADFSFARSRRSELHTLREVSIRHTRQPIRQDVKLLQQASYATALIEHTTEMDTPLPGLFRIFSEFLEALPTQKSGANLIFSFELKLLEELGMAPDLPASNLSSGATEIAVKLLERDFAFTSRIKLSTAQTNELRQFLHGFLIFHLGKIPSSRTAALAE